MVSTDDTLLVRIPRALVDAAREARDPDYNTCGCEGGECNEHKAGTDAAFVLVGALLAALPLDVEAGDEVLVEEFRLSVQEANVERERQTATMRRGADAYVEETRAALLARLATLRARVRDVEACNEAMREPMHKLRDAAGSMWAQSEATVVDSVVGEMRSLRAEVVRLRSLALQGSAALTQALDYRDRMDPSDTAQIGQTRDAIDAALGGGR